MTSPSKGAWRHSMRITKPRKRHSRKLTKSSLDDTQSEALEQFQEKLKRERKLNFMQTSRSSAKLLNYFNRRRSTIFLVTLITPALCSRDTLTRQCSRGHHIAHCHA